MPKQTGLGDVLTIDDSSGSGQNISNDCTDYQLGLPQNLLDVTGLDKSAIERLGALQDGSMSVNGVFNPASNLSHDVFKVRGNDAGVSARTVQLDIGGSTSGNPRLREPAPTHDPNSARTRQLTDPRTSDSCERSAY